jgi:D-3-phosphoglycerate dehydrogenase
MVVRSRTKVRKDLIDVCPNLKVIVRGGAGLDTIDHEYAKTKGIHGHEHPARKLCFSGGACDWLHADDGALAVSGNCHHESRKWDKKSFNGDEIGGKTLGLIGVGNIGKEVDQTRCS